MGLRWLDIVKKHLVKSERASDVMPSNPTLTRLLFIGFGKVQGFNYFEWDDQKWPNASDFEAIFINVVSLYVLISKWQEKYVMNKEEFEREPFEHLSKNMRVLSEQLHKVINSDRQIFALAAPDISLHLEGSGISRLYSRSINVYDWCPLPLLVIKEEGETSKDIDHRFSEYRKHIKRWAFYFDDKPKEIEYIDRSDLAVGQIYVTTIQSLFVNLSYQALGIGLRYGVLNKRGSDLLELVSGPIYLLHFPVDGNLREALRSLVREFCNVDLYVSEEPEWLGEVLPPRGAEIDQQVASFSQQIEELSGHRARLIEERRELEVWRRLLYESGNALEDVVLEALKILGLNNVQYGLKGDHDIIGELSGDILIFEVKGLTKSAGRLDVFALSRHIEEFEVKNPNIKVSKGVLVVNAYRNFPPTVRDKEGRQIFAGDSIKHAELLEFSLVDTRDLYRAVTDVIEGRLIDKDQFLQGMREATGIYSYK